MESHHAAGQPRLAALLANSLDAIALFDRQGNVRFVAGAIERVQGYPPGDFIGTNAFDHVHPEDLPRMKTTFQECVARHGEPVTAVFRARHRDGSWRTIEAVVASCLEDPEVGGIVANFRDISERVRLEARLLETQKMEAIGRLSSTVAHDFNNLLTAILGFGQLLAAEAGDHPRLAPAIEEIRKAGERARSLTRQLLTLGRRQEMRAEAFELGERLSDFEGLVRRLLGSGIELRMDLSPGAAPVMGDPARIEQVLLNLVINARDALAAKERAGGGSILVSTTSVEVEEAEARSRPDVRPGGYVMLSVADDGTGIEPQVLPHIFEPFFTTKEGEKGTGLGLATVYGVVRQMDGFVEVTSEPGVGTEFRVYLPRAEASKRPRPDPYLAGKNTSTREVAPTTSAGRNGNGW